MIVVSFISTEFVVTKLYIFEYFRGDATSMKRPSLGDFWALSPSEKFFRLICLRGNLRYPKFKVLVYY